MHTAPQRVDDDSGLAHNHVVEAVAVDVACGRDRGAEVSRAGRAETVRLSQSHRTHEHTGKGSVIDADVATHTGIRGADHDVAEAVAIHVSGGGDRGAEVVAGSRALPRPDRNRVEPGRMPEVEISLAGVRELPWRADDHVAEAVSVHVARGRDRRPEEPTVDVGLLAPARGLNHWVDRDRIRGAFIRDSNLHAAIRDREP
jgi:hypothetical protein